MADTTEPSESDWVRRVWVPGCSCCGNDDACGDHEDNTVHISFEIPGVKKDEIHLKVIPDGLRLEAWRDTHTQYVSEYAFLCPARTGDVKASYDNGILNVEVPLECKDPYDDAVKISIG